MLDISEKLKALNSIDATWYLATDYLAAIFTTLFAYTERQDHLTSQNVEQLRREMDRWLDVIGDVGRLLGNKVFFPLCLVRMLTLVQDLDQDLEIPYEASISNPLLLRSVEI
jgi:hypothetical protein